MTVTQDRVGVVITEGDIIRRYCNYTVLEAMQEFKWFMYLSGRGKPVIS